jgi:hypothetical protein
MSADVTEYVVARFDRAEGEQRLVRRRREGEAPYTAFVRLRPNKTGELTVTSCCTVHDDELVEVIDHLLKIQTRVRKAPPITNQAAAPKPREQRRRPPRQQALPTAQPEPSMSEAEADERLEAF